MEWNRELATQTGYFNHVSTEDYVAASFTYVGRWLSGSSDL